ncbi:bile acid:sodium symporter family protein [Treponema parvum]|uniref:Bile acid:sodium symporter family protein n=1 Tax=Treponema parvum TaxID=138851 RepID=A0A975IBL9_9SPIR|nr:bile acid:sodium symporter family protein [Treponema parvum]QTQ11010.1 bile acid:sodium symporter family protein [Treponema parvum]
MNRSLISGFNAALEKLMPFLTLSGLIIGFLLGPRAGRFSAFAVPLFAFMTFSGTINMNVSDFKQTLSHPLPIFMFLIVFHLIQPFAAWAAASVLLSGDYQIATGLVLLYSIPVAVSSSIWTNIFHGNIPLNITLILIDTFLGPVVTPLIVKIFCGAEITINSASMFMSLVWMIVVPSCLGIAANQISGGKIPQKFLPILKPASKIALFCVIIINAGKISPSLNFDMLYIRTGIITLALCFAGFFIANIFAGIIKLPYDQKVSFVFSAGMRNISAALVIAITYFEPRCSIPVVIGISFQQLLTSISGKILLKPETATQKK